MPLCFIAIQRSLTLIPVIVGLYLFIFLRNALDHSEVPFLLLWLLSHDDFLWGIITSVTLA